ncbi:phenylalanine--tRNA ligase beta subunit-related protein [Olsenella sp. YH-ols2217]|uniref:Phenylalanine--tRNA ligase beta subunit-related protein n=1 Tax=Kribbibacterium absianum TaxID=3044210 RepID=A0ABT6ZMA3_9ACTN|nr:MULTISPECIES: phenylalanine--tRNA ligase beta subunit-related protein [unclassified Olsenella]MDJ1122180.1 phenylalanine--tRNA ligase beta subunit-related protein [Olsenella sp. YH-ols2216]MDJ1130188.1 phenylalanine--tRNA ligase beta subunit-related protein [Olsenella sp. YH-ols2217]
MARFVVEDSFWELFPDASIGAVVVRGMKPASEVTDEERAEIEKLLSDANRAAERHLDSPTLSENRPVKVWREAYQKFKTKRGARVSIENLLKRVHKDRPVGPITPSVDLYNVISLTYALPVGGENVDAFEGDLRLGTTEGGDAFRGLGEEKDDPTLPGEVCYRDDAGAVCRCLNWRDGQRTALDDDSANAFLVIESVDPERAGDLVAAIDELAGLVTKYLGGAVVEKQILTRDNPTMPLD